MKKTKVILLDIGNVLLAVDFSQFVKGVALNHNTAYVIEQQFCQGSIKNALDTGRISPFEFYEKLISTGLTRNIGYEEFQSYWCRIFSVRNDFEGVIGTLYEQYSICIASDTDPLHFDYLQNEYAFIAEIETCFLSFNLGCIKIQKEYFEKVKYHEAVADSLMILIDDKRQNCDTAMDSDMEAIHFTSWENTLNILSQEK